MTIEEAIKQRHSVRKYIHKPLSTEIVRALEEKILECNKEGGLHIQLLAQALGLNTCWAGLSYRKVNEAYKIEKGEKVTCMIALGYGESQGVSHKIKTMEQMSNATSNSPSWFRKGVEGTKAGCKPKVLAKRGFSMVGYTKMDLGIAKLHFEIGAGKENFKWVVKKG
ncbi:nitroreductase family protein [Segatella copri]|uniref:Nitroreductase n=1 Tax=Segatella copri TaxID=165179 RepID=A0AAW5UVC0_9BACT|nr:nitroreductase family protein [Segatella copri]MCW4113286.1 nitroreductase [Segatella copri]MCW4123442.1 nitroreductase [Segatella copri]MCW4157208.1 nitroreductase [Segatella copri]